jgi:3-methyladenine DNA glycosylase Tag
MYRNRRPPNDDAYFENMSRVIFSRGVSLETVDKKWDDLKKAFNNFSIDDVSTFNKEDIQRLTSDPWMASNRLKIIATINNAKQFPSIRKLYGSFQLFLDSLDKSDNYVVVISELRKKFSQMFSSSIRIFLFSVGENVRALGVPC